MEKESSTDKFLRECGLSEKAGQVPEGKKLPEAKPDQTETARARRQQSQDEADKSYRRLNVFIRDELPAKIQQAFEQAAQNRVAGALGPLNKAVRQASSRIESCADKLARLPWNARIIWVAVLIGMGTVALGAALIRWTIIEDKFDEERRYESYGRQVAREWNPVRPGTGKGYISGWRVASCSEVPLGRVVRQEGKPPPRCDRQGEKRPDVLRFMFPISLCSYSPITP